MLREKLKDWHSLIPHCLTLVREVGSDEISNCKLQNLYLRLLSFDLCMYRNLTLVKVRFI